MAALTFDAFLSLKWRKWGLWKKMGTKWGPKNSFWSPWRPKSPNGDQCGSSDIGTNIHPWLQVGDAGGQVQAVPLGYHHQGGAGEAHWKAPHRQYEMVVKQEICVNLSNQFTKSASIWTLKISRRRVMFRTHKLSFWYQFLVGGNAHKDLRVNIHIFQPSLLSFLWLLAQVMYILYIIFYQWSSVLPY